MSDDHLMKEYHKLTRTRGLGKALCCTSSLGLIKIVWLVCLAAYLIGFTTESEARKVIVYIEPDFTENARQKIGIPKNQIEQITRFELINGLQATHLDNTHILNLGSNIEMHQEHIDLLENPTVKLERYWVQRKLEEQKVRSHLIDQLKIRNSNEIVFFEVYYKRSIGWRLFWVIIRLQEENFRFIASGGKILTSVHHQEDLSSAIVEQASLIASALQQSPARGDGVYHARNSLKNIISSCYWFVGSTIDIDNSIFLIVDGVRQHMPHEVVNYLNIRKQQDQWLQAYKVSMIDTLTRCGLEESYEHYEQLRDLYRKSLVIIGRIYTNYGEYPLSIRLAVLRDNKALGGQISINFPKIPENFGRLKVIVLEKLTKELQLRLQM